MRCGLEGLDCSCRISGTDIKDKSDLMKARKDVERQMERFKVCEKEMKTKAFSKEGLGQAAKLDPREKARNEMRDWINETVDKLTAEVRPMVSIQQIWSHCMHYASPVHNLTMPAIPIVCIYEADTPLHP